MAGSGIRGERFNAKARASTAGGSRKKGKGKKAIIVPKDHDQPRAPVGADSNSEVLAMQTPEDRENERREKIRLEVCSSSLEMS